MSTRAALFIQNEDASWLQIYSHYDGYPSHMLPALAKADPDAIRSASEFRQIYDDGRVEGFSNPRPPTRVQNPTMPGWAAHAYALTAKGWQHAERQDQLDQITIA